MIYSLSFPCFTKVCDDVDSDDDEDDDGSEDAATRLAKCLAFRRFIITKSLLFMSGSSSIVRAGARFGPLEVCNAAAMDEKTASNMRIAASLTLGPLLLVKFSAHSYELEQTSIIAVSPQASNSELSLAQSSMRAFTACVRGMACDAPQHAMSKASRVNALLASAMGKASSAVPSSKDGWNFYRELVDNGDACVGVPDDELRLGKTLFSFLSLAMTSSESSNNNKESNTTTRLCLFSELISNGMHGEAVECCHLISSAAEAFSEPNMKEQLGVVLLRAWELGPAPGGEEDCGERVGVLGVVGLKATIFVPFIAIRPVYH